MARPEKPPPPSKSGGYLFAQMWRDLRLGAKLDQHATAAALDCSAPHISNIERGRRLPSFDLVVRFEELVGSGGVLRSLWEWATVERAEHQSSAGPPPTGRTHPGDRSQFVRDLFPRDGTVLGPNQRFRVGWEIRNAGTVTWRERFLMQAGPAVPMYAPVLEDGPAPIPLTRPQETAAIRVMMRAPKLPGETIVYFYMVDADGALCFPDRYAAGVYVRITVREPTKLPR